MSTAEKHSFQAEIQQLLNIVVHSLYTDKEIFVRELISNAADACEKLRFLQTSGKVTTDSPLTISIATDEKEKRFTITDTGVGMTHDELIQNLGTIAHSGSKVFLKNLQAGEGQKPDANLIGQFGVGFYSAFMVGNSVTVLSRSYLPDEQGWKWTSDGQGGYEIEPVEDLPRGTRITIDLKEDAKQFAESGEVERIINRYSNFVQFPIELNSKALNTVRAIWTRNKNEVKEEEYNEFYQYVGHDSDKPLMRLHFSADAPLSIQALLFVPSHNYESLGMVRSESEVHLYCRKVLIQSKAKGLFPEWLRFLKGVVDSEDLPLNISRETMQDTSLIQKLNKVLTSRFLKFLEEQAEKEPETYTKFYEQYNRFIKEGVASDFTHRDSLSKLLRYQSSGTEKDKETSLADYVKRMPSDQKEIYYLLAATREAGETSPYYEVFKARGYEVLFMTDPWDEFVMEHVRDFDGKKLQAAEKADLKLTDEPKSDQKLTKDEAVDLAKWWKETLGDKVREIRSSERLVGSPAVILDSDQFMTTSMRRMLKSMKQSEGAASLGQQDLEFNPAHPLISRLNKMRQTDDGLAKKVAEQIADGARAAAGLLEDPRSMLQRMNELLELVLK